MLEKLKERIRKTNKPEQERSRLDKNFDKYNNIILGIIILILLFNIYIIFGVIKEFNGSSLGLILISIIFIRFIIFKFSKKERRKSYIISMKNFSINFVKQIFILFGIVILFSVYHNEINPAKLDIIELTNGEKSIAFMEMSHIGNNDFYDYIDTQISNYSSKDYILYFEGVDVDIDEKEIEDKLGIMPSEETYTMITNLLGTDIKAQDNMQMISKSKKAKNTDVSFSEMLGKKETNFDNINLDIKNKDEINNIVNIGKEQKIEKINNNNKNIDINNKLGTTDKIGENIKNTENKFYFKGLQYFSRAIFNVSLKHPEILFKLQSFVVKDLSEFYNDKVINLRNEKLAYQVINSEDKKIMITYGALHFKGFFELLKQNDSKWKVSNKISKQVF